MWTNFNPSKLVAGTTFQLQPDGQNVRADKVVLANSSPYPLNVLSGYAARWLTAWTADVFALNGDSPSLTITVGLPSFIPPSSDMSLYSTWLPISEDAPGTYPIALTPNALASGPPPISSGRVVIINTATSATIAGGASGVRINMFHYSLASEPIGGVATLEDTNGTIYDELRMGSPQIVGELGGVEAFLGAGVLLRSYTNTTTIVGHLNYSYARPGG